MAINTLRIANRLKEAEREGRTAEEIALVFQEVQDSQADQAATKEFVRGEFDRLRVELNADSAALRAELKADLAALRADMEKRELRLMNNITVRFGVMLAATVAALGGLKVFF